MRAWASVSFHRRLCGERKTARAALDSAAPYASPSPHSLPQGFFAFQAQGPGAGPRAECAARRVHSGQREYFLTVCAAPGESPTHTFDE